MNQRSVPVLITWDVDPDRWATAEKRENALTYAIDLCEAFGIHSTFFITANYAHEYPVHLQQMRELHQEIGCHGLNHTDEEDYDRMPEEMQRSYIEKATQKLEADAGLPISSFRSPRVKTSSATLRLLAHNGYSSDSSICPQRIDFVSSNLINPGWLIAPRNAYHPNAENAFRKGNLPIWEIPISAVALPFISSLMRVMGVKMMKALFWLLYQEAKRTGKPIVYLAHPTEFIYTSKGKVKFRLSDLSPSRIRVHGFMIRNCFYRLGGMDLLEATRELFQYMASFQEITFLSCSEYVQTLNHSN